jgi:hypothetical protein
MKTRVERFHFGLETADYDPAFAASDLSALGAPSPPATGSAGKAAISFLVNACWG